MLLVPVDNTSSSIFPFFGPTEESLSRAELPHRLQRRLAPVRSGSMETREPAHSSRFEKARSIDGMILDSRASAGRRRRRRHCGQDSHESAGPGRLSSHWMRHVSGFCASQWEQAVPDNVGVRTGCGHAAGQSLHASHQHTWAPTSQMTTQRQLKCNWCEPDSRQDRKRGDCGCLWPSRGRPQIKISADPCQEDVSVWTMRQTLCGSQWGVNCSFHAGHACSSKVQGNKFSELRRGADWSGLYKHFFIHIGFERNYCTVLVDLRSSHSLANQDSGLR